MKRLAASFTLLGVIIGLLLSLVIHHYNPT